MSRPDEGESSSTIRSKPGEGPCCARLVPSIRSRPDHDGPRYTSPVQGRNY